MSDKANIKDAIKKLSEKNHDGYSIACKVDSIDLVKGTCYCIPINGDADIQGVRLQAQVSTGFLIKPTVGSVVLVSFLSDQSGFISQYSTFTEMQLNGDANGGIAKTLVLKTKYNTIETAINQLKAAIISINAAAASSPTTPVTNVTLAAFLASISVVLITLTTQSEISNTTVKHGG